MVNAGGMILPHFIVICDNDTILPSLREAKWGVMDKNVSRLEAINTKDILFIYVKGSSALGRGCICGPFIVSKTSVEPKNGFYFKQGYSKIIEFEQNTEPSYIGLKEIIQKIELIKNKSHWGMTFMGRAIIKISQDDSDTIISEIEKNGAPVRM